MQENNTQNIESKNNSQVVDINIVSELHTSFLNYSLSIIVSRALPDVRDGLKPVHRRILYSMWNLGMTNDKPYKKSARIVGDVIGKYHPHGDTAVYDTLVRMAQDFNYRYPLIQGHGNFGSIDGDSAAAMRYTEARMAKLSGYILEDLEKNTVKFQENYDGSEKEPATLPSMIPNLLLNGSVGIAVGMATSIPPHNLNNVYDSLLFLLKKPDCNVEELIEIIQGPDFPTGAIIKGKQGIIDAYTKGHGSIVIEAKYHLENNKIVITEIPFQVNKSKLIINLAELIKNPEKQLQSISDLRDESNREGIRIVVEFKKNVDEYEIERIKETLFRYSSLRTRFSVHLLALANGVPTTLSLKDILQHFIDHRIDVIIKRTKFDLNKQEEKLEILKGIEIAISDLDNTIKIIRESSTPSVAKKNLMDFYSLTENQSLAILDIRLQRLTALEKDKILNEIKEIENTIQFLNKILNDKDFLLTQLEEEFEKMKKLFSDSRKTQIDDNEVNFLNEIDLIKKEDVVITLTKQNYIKKTKLDEFRLQNRGGVGIRSIKKSEDENSSQTAKTVLVTDTHNQILFISNFGKIYKLLAYQIPTYTRTAKGVFVNNLIESIDKKNSENIEMIFNLDEIQDNDYLVFLTKKGYIKKTKMTEFVSIRANGKKAINLREDDAVVKVVKVTDNDNLIISTSDARVCRISIKNVRSQGRTATGVKAMKLDKTHIVSVSASNNKTHVFSIINSGMGKINLEESIRLTKRNAKGVKIFKLQKNEELVSCFYVNEDDEIIITNTNGVSIRTTLEQFRTFQGRNTKGVRAINLDKNEKVLTAAVFSHKEEISENA